MKRPYPPRQTGKRVWTFRAKDAIIQEDSPNFVSRRSTVMKKTIIVIIGALIVVVGILTIINGIFY